MEIAVATAKRVASRKKASMGGRHGKHLLCGLLKCGECGSNYSIRGTAHYTVNGSGERRSRGYYGCTGHYGHGACSNGQTVRLDIAEQKVLEAIRSDLFKPEHFEAFSRAVRRKLQHARAARASGNSDAKRRLADVDRKIGRIVQAVEDGAGFAEFKERLAQLQADRKQLTATLKPDNLDRAEELWPKLEDRYHELVNDLGNGMPSAELSRARRIVAGLVGDVIVRSTADGGLVAEMAGRYPGLLNLVFDNRVIGFAQRKSR